MTAAKVARQSLAPYEVIPLYDILRRTASRLPDKVAVIDGDREATFSQLDQQSDSFAAALASIGVKKGDHIGLYAPNCIEFITAYYGILKAGAVASTVNAAYKDREVAHQLNDSGAEVMVVHQALLPNVEGAKAEVSGLKTVIVIGEAPEGALSLHKLIADNPGPPPEITLDPKEDLAVLPYSSGTTGLPKGVMLTHYNLTSNLKQFLSRGEEEASPRKDDIVFVHLPMFHIYGQTVLMNGAIAAGNTQVLMARFDMIEALELLSKHKVTLFYTVPPLILGLTQHPAVQQYDLSSIRMILSGAAPLGADLQTRLKEVIGIPVIQGYGMTETSPVTNADFLEADLARPGSIGPAMADTDEKIVDVETGEKELPAGEVGELIIRGPQVMKGYWNNEEATADTLRGEWLYTGDMARMDEDGYFYIVDRKKELIKYKGFQVAPAEMEALLLEHPGVADVAVVGKPDLEAGELPKAYVVAKGEGVTGDDIMGFVEGRVAGFKKIREVEFVDQIPKNPSGKILRRVLVDQERERAGLS